MSDRQITGIDLQFRLNRQPSMTVHTNAGIQETRPFDLGGFAEAIANHARQSIFTPPEMLATNLVEWAIFWRPPMNQQVLIGVEGSKEATAMTIPLPGLVCQYAPAGKMKVAAFRGCERPSLRDALFKAPLPNVSGGDGTVCMGNTARPFQGKHVADLDPDKVWTAYFSSAFTSHGAKDRCRRYPEDVRLLLYALEGKPAFPEEELLPMQATLEGWL